MADPPAGTTTTPRPRRKRTASARQRPSTTRALDVQEVTGELADRSIAHPGPAPAPPATAGEQASPPRTLQGFRAWVSSLRMSGVATEVDGFGLDPLFCVRMAGPLDALYRRWWRVRLHGLENVPPEGRVMLVANHSGGLPYDGLMLTHGIRRDHPRHRLPRMLVEDDFWHMPFVGSALARLGGVRANPDNAERLLRDDQVVAVFPEGTKGLGKPFQERYRLQRFGRGGFVKLALRTHTPILPVAIIGAEEVHPLLGRVPLPVGGLPFLPVTPTFPWLGLAGALPLPTRWSITIGPPVDLGVRGEVDTSDTVLVNELTERVRAEIQRMLDDGLAARGSAWR